MFLENPIKTFNPLTTTPARLFHPESLQSLKTADQKLFERFGQGPLVPVPYDLIHCAFEYFAKHQPGAVAVRSNSEIDFGKTITYCELEKVSNHLAAHLISLGVKPGDHVGLFLQRSIDMVVGILGILKAGAAYVPQDARITPLAQLQNIVEACEMKLILTQSHFLKKEDDSKLKSFVHSDVKVLAIDEFRNQLASSCEAEVHVQSEASLPVCFVLFTSGTTGRPNGVQVTHKNVCNILLTQPGGLGLGPGVCVSQILNISFDMAAWEILGALSHGATLIIRGKDVSKTIAEVEVVIATPSILASLDIEKCKNVKTVAVAGEPCPLPLAEKWSAFSHFYNSCGPTEVTIVNTMQLYKPNSQTLTIGKPTPNNTVYILDENLKPCAIGEIGEMWAGGDCVSAGYLKNLLLTDERYKPDPFLGRNRKMFRTRDLGRWSAEGELEHFGRTDDQVKIRGFRVELDSVSSALEKTKDCAQAVTLRLDSQTLAAFVKPKHVDLNQARKEIEKALPYYCVPSILIALDDFPFTSRGKIDKKALTILAVETSEGGL